MSALGSQMSPRIGHRDGGSPSPADCWGSLTCSFDGVSEGTRTPDTQDHNLVL